MYNLGLCQKNNLPSFFSDFEKTEKSRQNNLQKFQNLFVNWENNEVQPKVFHLKIPILNLWMIWEKLRLNLSFTVENKVSIYVKENCPYLKLLPQILGIYQWIGKNMFSIDKNKTLNSSWIEKTLNKNVDYLMYYRSRRRMKILQLKVYI